MSEHDCTHIQIFQRLDRARKGYLTQQDILDFMKESKDTKDFKQSQLAMVLPDKKIKYQKFVKTLFDSEALRAEQLKTDKTFLSISPFYEG